MSILRYEENGIEFFTLEATGESGMSQAGLARLCGVSRKAINNLLNSVSMSSCPEFLKPLQEKDLRLITSVHEFKNATILQDSVCARILEWYAFESQRTTETARQAFRKFATVGIRLWIQGITGWQNPLTTPLPTPDRPSPDDLKSADFSDLSTQLDRLERDLLVALKHRHAIHNLVEKPTVVDLSLNQIVHTAVHVQADKLNGALIQVQTLRRDLLELEVWHRSLAEGQNWWQTCQELSQRIEELRQENSRLQQTVEDRTQRLAVLRKRCQFKPLDKLNLQQLPALESSLEKRIQEISEILMAQQKRTGGDRAKRTCRLKATILARYEMGESLEQIAEEVQRPYETVKTYVKIARKAIEE